MLEEREVYDARGVRVDLFPSGGSGLFNDSWRLVGIAIGKWINKSAGAAIAIGAVSDWLQSLGIGTPLEAGGFAREVIESRRLPISRSWPTD